MNYEFLQLIAIIENQWIASSRSQNQLITSSRSQNQLILHNLLQLIFCNQFLPTSVPEALDSPPPFDLLCGLPTPKSKKAACTLEEIWSR